MSTRRSGITASSATANVHANASSSTRVHPCPLARATMVAIVMARASGHGWTRVLLLAFAWTLAVALLAVIPDRRVLIAVAYAPLFLVGAPFHWPPVSFLQAI